MEKEFIYSQCLSNNILHLIIFPTEKCNFRCVYCYEDHDLKRMDNSVVESIKLFLKNKLPTLTNLYISWFGGEPLLEINIIKDISTFIKKTIQNNSYQVDFIANITTNAFLLNKKTIDELVSYNVKEFQISLDGEKEFHNLLRKHYNSKIDTFSKIFSNLKLLKNINENIVIILRLHLTKDNLLSIKSLLKKISIEFNNDKRFQVFLKPLIKYGENTYFNDLKTSEFKLISQDLENDFNKNGINFIEFDKNYICYASKANSFVIRSNGNINKCTVGLYEEKNQVGYLNEFGDLIINNKLHQKWLKGISTGDEKILSCPYNFVEL